MAQTQAKAPTQAAPQQQTEGQQVGPSMSKTNSQAQASLPPPPKGAMDNLKKNLGTVDSLDGFTSAVGGFLTGLAPGKGNICAGSLEAVICIKQGVEIKATYDFKLSNDGKKMDLEGNMALQVSKVFSAVFVDLKVGVIIRGGFKAKGDNGKELMDLVCLAMLPKVQSVSTRLANALFGGADNFTTRVSKGMDEEDEVKTSLGASASASFNTTTGNVGPSVKGEMEIGGRSEDTISKKGDSLVKSNKKGMVVSQKFSVGDMSWAMAFDQIDEEVKLSSENEFDPKNKAIAQVVVGAVQAIPSLIELVIKALRKAGKGDSPLMAGLAMARNKIVSSHIAALEALKPDSTKVGLDFELSFSPKKNGFKVVLSSIISGKQELDAKFGKESLEAKLKSGQVLLDVDF